MASPDLVAIDEEHQQLESSTQKLAADLAQLHHRGQSSREFQAIEVQETHLLTSCLRDVATFVDGYTSQGLLTDMGNSLLARVGWRPGRRELVTVAIELLQSIEKRTEEYKTDVMAQSEECTDIFAKASNNKKSLESLSYILSYRDAHVAGEIDNTCERQENCSQELAEDEIRVAYHEEKHLQARKKEARWRKVRADPRFETQIVLDGQREIARLEDETARLNLSLTELLVSAQRTNKLSNLNRKLCDQSEQMIQDSKTLAMDAEHVLNSARAVLIQLSDLNELMNLLSEVNHDRLTDEKDSMKRLLLAIQASITPLTTNMKQSYLVTDGPAATITKDIEDELPWLGAL
ncbi:MAG: hypothetical protein Q9166_007318 [cf. Caloplaca sp. 2 TL-2023]